MTENVRALFANAQGSAIRELAALAGEPDMVSLAGGMPDPAVLPLDRVRAAYARVLDTSNPGLLQYGPTDGLPAAKQAISGFLADEIGAHDPADWVITSGSQQAIDLVARVLIDAGDAVAVETHAYPATLQAFRFCQARIVGVERDGEGMLPDALRAAAKQQRLKAVYLVPSFGNPTGALMGEARRVELLKVAAEIGAVLIEDDPYRHLAFDGTLVPPTMHRLNTQHGLGAELVYLTSFSKTIAPALRVGALLAPPAVRRAVVLAKQAADIHSGLLDQAVIAELLKGDAHRQHLATLARHYGAKGRALHAALQTHVGDRLTWEVPSGGMFIWGTLRAAAPAGIDWKPLFREHRVLFVPGKEFAADGRDAGHLRLSFAHPAIEKLALGAQRLAALLNQALA
jgi:DNA-binding transcriptional MocR family regulator